MTLILTLEQGPRAQAVRQARLDDGELVVGRGADADWQIDDPDMFISRAHFKVSARPDGYVVTDMSSSGLFVDNSSAALGSGNALRLQSGMRLRLGDYVVGVEVQKAPPPAPYQPPPLVHHAAPPPAEKPPRSNTLDDDGFFSAREELPAPPKRPSNLPDPFEKPVRGGFQDFGGDAQRGNSQAFDDPFSMEPVRTSEPQQDTSKGKSFFDDPFEAPAENPPRFPSDEFEAPRPAPAPGESDFSFGPTSEPSLPPQSPAPAAVSKRAPWELPDPDEPRPAKTDWNSTGSDWKSLPPEEPVPRDPVTEEPSAPLGWKDLPEEPASEPVTAEPPQPEPAPHAEPEIEVLPPEPVAQVFVEPLPQAEPPAPTPRPIVRPAPVSAPMAIPEPSLDDTALRDAFLRGLGLRADDLRGKDTVAEMEKFGREYRLMMEGLMQLLRKRAEEKSNARVAQTVVGASEVNPLKFLPTVDDAMSMIASDRSSGFLRGEAAISDAVRDLAQHHVRTWRGLQTALRRMIDRFDPASLEEELKTGSSLGSLLTGGRGAKLWELYQKRHREIATNAESRFLGDIGADFRDAYEEE
jgi:type VI secretion system protein ImpI